MTPPPTSPTGAGPLTVSNAPSGVLATESGDDVLAFVMRSGTSTTDAGIDRSGPPVLEVAGMWSDIVLDVRHFEQGSRPITGGTSTGYRWRFLGMPIAWVPQSFSRIAWMFGPTLSEASEEWANDFYVPNQAQPDTDFNLFEWDGDQCICRLNEKWDGFADIGEERHTFAELIASGRAEQVEAGIYALPVDEGTRVVAGLGDLTLFGQMVPRSRKLMASPLQELDHTFLGISTFIGFVFAMLLVVLWTTPASPETAVVDIDKRVASLVIQMPDIEQPKPSKDPLASNKPAGAKAKKKEGRKGKKTAKMKHAKGDPVMDKQQLDKQVAAQAGLLAAFSDDSALNAAFGDTALTAGLTSTGIGGTIGAKGIRMGSGGIGSRGGSLGGGGTADGFGGMGTNGKGGGDGRYGKGGGQFKPKGLGKLGRLSGEAIILGSLDKSLIDEVIKRHMNQIRYCYQRELTKKPDLGGKVTVKFVISATGGVSKASIKSSSLGDKTVESCVTSRFMRFTFPKPKGGGIVIVSYPFIFSPG